MYNSDCDLLPTAKYGMHQLMYPGCLANSVKRSTMNTQARAFRLRPIGIFSWNSGLRL